VKHEYDGLEVRGLTVGSDSAGRRRVDGGGQLSLALRAGQTLALSRRGERQRQGEVGEGAERLLVPNAGQILLHWQCPVGGARRAAGRIKANVQSGVPGTVASLNPMHTVDPHLQRAVGADPGHPRGDTLTAAVHDMLCR